MPRCSRHHPAEQQVGHTGHLARRVHDTRALVVHSVRSLGAQRIPGGLAAQRVRWRASDRLDFAARGRDATDFEHRGDSNGHSVQGDSREDSSLPLRVFSGDRPVRVPPVFTASAPPAASLEDDCKNLIDRIRAHGPHTRVILRTDSGLGNALIIAVCEAMSGVDSVIGRAACKARLGKRIALASAARAPGRWSGGRPVSPQPVYGCEPCWVSRMRIPTAPLLALTSTGTDRA